MVALLTRMKAKRVAAISAQPNLHEQVKPQSGGHSQNLLETQGVPA